MNWRMNLFIGIPVLHRKATGDVEWDMYVKVWKGRKKMVSISGCWKTVYREGMKRRGCKSIG